MIDTSQPRPSIVRQCRLVSIARSSFYYQGRRESSLNLELLRVIDEQFLETPFFGSRQMARWLRRNGYRVGRKRVRRLMGCLACRPSFSGHAPRGRSQAIRSTPTCCETSISRGRTRSGAPM
jgi:putative transposase